MDDFDKLIDIQRVTASRLRQENEVDNKIKLLDIISSLTSAKKSRVQIEEIILESQMQGMNESQVNSTINALKRDRLLSEPEAGFFRLL